MYFTETGSISRGRRVGFHVNRSTTTTGTISRLMQDIKVFNVCVNTLLWIRTQVCIVFVPEGRIFGLEEDAGARSVKRGGSLINSGSRGYA